MLRWVRRWVREPAVLGTACIVLALCAFGIGKWIEHRDHWDAAAAMDSLHEGGQLVALNLDSGGGFWGRVARVFAVAAFAAFGFEVLRAVSAPAVERMRLAVRRWTPWLRRRQNIAVIGSDARADWMARAIAVPDAATGREQVLVTQVRDSPTPDRSVLGPLLVACEPDITVQSLITDGIDRADQVIVTGGDDAVTLARLNAVLALPDGRPADAPQRIVRVELSTPEVLEQVRSANWDRQAGQAGTRSQAEVRVWNADELAVRHALSRVRLDGRHPFSRPGGRTELVVMGFGGSARVLAAALLRQAHHVDEQKCRITVIDPEPARCIARFRASFPLVDEVAHIDHHRLDAFDRGASDIVRDKLSDGSANVVVSISVGDVDSNLALALGLGRDLGRRRGSGRGAGLPCALPLLVRQARLADTRDVFARFRGSGFGGSVELFPWGGLDDACRPEDVLESRIDLRARRLHDAYLTNHAPRPEDAANPLSARRPWRDLWSFFRDDNRNRADFLRSRLRAVGLRIAGPGEPGVLVSLEQLDDGVRDALARMEHRRWVVSRVMAGWERGDRDDAARRHPSICPWSELDGAERAKDDVARDVGQALLPGERLVRE
jgi:hypothetical protein